MLSYCLKCRKHTENKIPKIVKTKNPTRIMVTSNSAVTGSKKSRFIKEQEDSRLSGNMLRRNIPFLGYITIGDILLRY